MAQRTYRALQALLLAATGLRWLYLVWSGDLSWYINQRFAVLTFGGALGLLILARAVRPPLSAAPEASRPLALPGSGWGLLLIALPLALGVLVPGRPLGAAAIATRGLNASLPRAQGVGEWNAARQAALARAPGERTVLDWLRVYDPAASEPWPTGERADLVGFVYRPAHLAPGEFIVSRFAVTCCSADAAALGLLVRWPNAGRLAENTWVRVRGPIGPGQLGPVGIPLISAESVEGVAVPEPPYLFP